MPIGSSLEFVDCRLMENPAEKIKIRKDNPIRALASIISSVLRSSICDSVFLKYSGMANAMSCMATGWQRVNVPDCTAMRSMTRCTVVQLELVE